MPDEPHHPFNKPTADVVLRSCDNVDFRVHKIILSEASPVFEGMFSLAQPATPATPDAQTDDGPFIVSLPETGKTLEFILRICYPLPNPHLGTLEEVADVIKAAKKYGMDGPLQIATKRLVDPEFLEANIFLVYSIAWEHDLDAETALAAKFSLRRPMPEDFAKLKKVPAAALYQFMDYRARCVSAALRFVFHPEHWHALWDSWFSGSDYKKHGFYTFYCEDCAQGMYSFSEYPNIYVDTESLQDEMAEAVQKVPSGTTFDHSAHIARAVLEKTSDGFCVECQLSGLENSRVLCQEFGKLIDEEAVSKVPFWPESMRY